MNNPVQDFRAYLLRCTSRGNYRAVCLLRDKRLDRIAQLLADGEATGHEGAALEAYVIKRCRMNPMLWIALFSIVVDIIKLWLAWRHPQQWGVA